VNVAQLREAVRAAGLLRDERPVLAMLSGGRDSVCLLDVLVALRGADAVSALHVNYGLRGDRADGDERHCKALCERLGVELSVLHAGAAPSAPASASTGAREARAAAGPAGGGTGPGEALRGGALGETDPGESGPRAAPGAAAAGNLQAWARELRYAAAGRLADERDSLIATGHTASDQVETILYRLAASPGRRALLGMAAAEGRLIRPLLGVTREQTAGYCEQLGLRWCEDESNADDRFARVRVRAGMVPALRAVHPAAEANVLRTARLLREETALLEGLVDAELGERDSIALARLGELPPALARMVVVRLAECAVGTYVPQAGERVGELLALGARGGRAELHVGGQAGAVIERGVLSMVKLPARPIRFRSHEGSPGRE
jgi:tRNA(Ile)-lysidine synthase